MKAIVIFKKHSYVLLRQGELCRAVVVFASYAGVTLGVEKAHGVESV